MPPEDELADQFSDENVLLQLRFIVFYVLGHVSSFIESSFYVLSNLLSRILSLVLSHVL